MKIKTLVVGILSVGGLFVLLSACAPAMQETLKPCPATITAGVGGLIYAPARCKLTLGGSSKTVVIQADKEHPFDTVSTNWPSAIADAQTDQKITFKAPGTYTYKCHIHGILGMGGSITVEN